MGGASVRSAALAALLPVMGYCIAQRVIKEHLARLKFSEAPQRLQNIFYKLTQKASVPQHSHINLLISEDYLEDCFVVGDKIGIGKVAFKCLPKDQTEFVVAHEIAHMVFPDHHSIGRSFTAENSLFYSSFLAPIFAATYIQGWPAFGFIGAYLATATAQTLMTRSVMRREEYWCDNYAVNLTENIQGAQNYFLQDTQGLHNSFHPFLTHPTHYQRIDALERIREKKESDIPALVTA